MFSATSEGWLYTARPNRATITNPTSRPVTKGGIRLFFGGMLRMSDMTSERAGLPEPPKMIGKQCCKEKEQVRNGIAKHAARESIAVVEIKPDGVSEKRSVQSERAKQI